MRTAWLTACSDDAAYTVSGPIGVLTVRATTR
ncbi:unannotated protein [freshwater metagenome]|uniref:Unannotated protein n=1 Tax=freshwater metagenome TaxID=449393 RepID=A0A6J6ZQK2_9ZZZZ